MSRPYDVGPGWWAMLDEQVAKAKALIPDITHEEKEKYGRCDLYFSSDALLGGNDEIYAIEAEIEKQSLRICEFCGRPGRLREDRRWMQTLCDRCAALDPLERRKVAEEKMAQYERSAPSRLEKRLTDFYGKPVEEIVRIEGDEEYWDKD